VKTLIIVESPTKARLVGRYARAIMADVTARTCLGHLRDLPPDELGVDVERGFFPHYVLQPGRADLVRDLRAEMRAAERLFLASDPDREGEAVAWHILQVFKPELAGKEVWRVTFHEITARAVQAALKQPRKIDIRLVQAAVARRVMDRLVGYLISPVLWKHVRGRDLSAGRVQTAALRILAEAEQHSRTIVEMEL
jgi:DNA topoisomerase-1